MNNLGLVSCNKRFLYAAIGAPGSTHDARLLKSVSIYSDIINGLVIHDFTLISLCSFTNEVCAALDDKLMVSFASQKN